VFVIERAETMNDQAANRMLKTLEEPAPFAHLLLLTARPGDVLPTISSRCQRVRFDTPAPEQIAADLERRSVAPDTALACARLALGDAERALRLALGEGPALRAGAESLARAALRDELAGAPWTAILAQAKRAGDAAQAEVEQRVAGELDFLPTRDRRRAEREGAEAAKRSWRRARLQALDEGLSLVGLWLRDVACVIDGAPELAHAVDRIDELRADAEGRSAHRLRAGVALVDETRFALSLYVSDELALEALASRLARAAV
jgi:DNA polymerase-3 subunit delta'